MKKLLCIILSALILLAPLMPVITYASEINSENTDSAAEFVSEIGYMMSKSENDFSEYGNSSLLNETDGYSEFEMCKLIVKSDKNIDTCGATEVISGYNDLWILKYNSPEETALAYEYYSDCKDVEYVEADRKLQAISTETAVEAIQKKYNSWGPSYIGLDTLNNDIASGNVIPEETVVAVLDTGVQADHPAFNGRVIATEVNTSTSGERNNSSDDNGHGTQVAGVIIDSTLDNVTVRAYKVLDMYGQGTLITLAAGIICAVNDGVDVINMSIAFAESSEILKEAIMLADRNNIILVAGAGNDSCETLFYPASYDGVMKIGAINESGVIANFSTRGKDIDFAAPGVNIYTATTGSRYKSVSGTSFSSPIVAGLAATLLSCDPELSSEDIYEIFVENSISVQETDADIKYGNGIINAPAYINPDKPVLKTNAPYFSHPTAIVKEEIDLEIFCDTPDSVIYYTTDRTVPSKTNPSSIIYDGNPIRISQTTIITAVAYCEGRYRSSVTTFASIIVPVVSEDYFEIDSLGTITSFSGTHTSFTVPDTVDGITVTGIGETVFANTSVSEVFLPMSVTTIGKSAFEGCTNLKTVSAKGVTLVGERAFYNCIWLKNIYMEQIDTIGKYAFYSVCSLHYELTGLTFNLHLDNATTISEGAFQLSAISGVHLIDARSIGKNAFLDCPALVTVHIQYLSNISNEAFKNCSSLSTAEIHGLSSLAVGTFSGCTALKEIRIPDAAIVLSRAFENCKSLEEITLESASTIYSAAFTGCNALRIIIVPSMTSFESAVYKAGSTTYPKFSDALQAFIAPNFEKTSAYMFGSAPNILAVSFRNLSSIADYTFSGCKKMMYLNIQSVTEISELAFDNSEIDFIDARNLKSAANMPDNSGIMLSTHFTQATSTAKNLKVYGTAGSVAETFATANNYTFHPIPYIYEEIPKYITEISGTVSVKAAGFDLTYQWYSNTVDSNVGGTPIEGATDATYTFSEDDTEYYYYCVITQDDFGVITEYATETIIKDPKPADYTNYNLAVSEAYSLNPSNYTNFEIVEQELLVDVSGKRSCEQRTVDLQAAAIRSAISRLRPNKVTAASLSASKTKLKALESVKVKIYTNPPNSIYQKVEWSSDNMNAFVVTKNGKVRCVGDGTAYISARIINHDGTYVIARLRFRSKTSSPVDKFYALIYKFIFILFSGVQ